MKTVVLKLIKLILSNFFENCSIGLYHHIERILQGNLSTHEYLDALYVVREKLHGLHLILREYCLDVVLYVHNRSKSDEVTLLNENYMDVDCVDGKW